VQKQDSEENISFVFGTNENNSVIKYLNQKKFVVSQYCFETFKVMTFKVQSELLAWFWELLFTRAPSNKPLK